MVITCEESADVCQRVPPAALSLPPSLALSLSLSVSLSLSLSLARSRLRVLLVSGGRLHWLGQPSWISHYAHRERTAGLGSLTPKAEFRWEQPLLPSPLRPSHRASLPFPPPSETSR